MIKLTIKIDTKVKKGTSANLSISSTPYKGKDDQESANINRLENAMALLYQKAVSEKQAEIYDKASKGQLLSVYKEAADFYASLPKEENKEEEK